MKGGCKSAVRKGFTYSCKHRARSDHWHCQQIPENPLRLAMVLGVGLGDQLGPKHA